MSQFPTQQITKKTSKVRRENELKWQPTNDTYDESNGQFCYKT